MATTTNYSWTTPDDTGLVKDGASAIRTLGSSIDTTTKALNPSTTLGDIEYRSSTANTNTRLPIGSTGNVLTVAGGVPTWAAPAAAGGMTLISETVASSLNSLTLSSIPQTYKQIMLIWSGIFHSNNQEAWSLYANSTNLTSANQMMRNSTNLGISNFADSNTNLATSGQYAFGLSCNSTNLYDRCSGYMLMDNYSSTTKKKTFQLRFSFTDNLTPDKRQYWGSGTIDSTTAITELVVKGPGAGPTFSNATDTSIRLYGIS